MVDNYDSFTFNLVHYLEQLDAEVIVKRNDQISIAEIKQLAPSHIVLSPGPCDPNKAGLSLEIVKQFKGETPILGVCLGHQAIAQSFGAKIIKAEKIVHGKTSKIYHSNQGIFNQLPQGFKATRYHSLIIDENTLPECFEITSWTEKEDGSLDNIMGIKHKEFAIEGVQFHPESVLSEFGMDMLERFINCKNKVITL